MELKREELKDKKKFLELLDKTQNDLSEAKENYMNALIYGMGISVIEIFKVIKFHEETIDPFMRLVGAVKRYYKDFKLEKQDDIGNLMTLEDFVEACDCGGFIDYDGYGYYATADKQSDVVISPSDVSLELVREDFTHVKWYNR